MVFVVFSRVIVAVCVLVIGSLMTLWILSPPLYKHLEWKYRRIRIKEPDWLIRLAGFVALTVMYTWIGKDLGPHLAIEAVAFPQSMAEAAMRISVVIGGVSLILAACQVYAASPWWLPKIPGFTYMPSRKWRLVFAGILVTGGVVFIWSGITIKIAT